MRQTFLIQLYLGIWATLALAQAPTIPDKVTRQNMIRESLEDFSSAVIKADFSAFHAKLAKPFKDKYTATDLKNVFQTFIDQKMDLSGVGKMTPILNQAPELTRDGVLKLTGHFNTSPSTLFFEIFYFEYPAWKVLSIDIRVREDPSLKLPTSENQLELVKTTIHSFAVAVLAKDFTEFHASLATNFREKYSAEDLKAAFKDFIDQKIDLTVLQTQTPIFHQAPFTDPDDVLILAGHYDTSPNRTNFVLKFYERPIWKLLSIDIHIGDN